MMERTFIRSTFAHIATSQFSRHPAQTNTPTPRTIAMMSLTVNSRPIRTAHVVPLSGSPVLLSVLEQRKRVGRTSICIALGSDMIYVRWEENGWPGETLTTAESVTSGSLHTLDSVYDASCLHLQKGCSLCQWLFCTFRTYCLCSTN